MTHSDFNPPVTEETQPSPSTANGRDSSQGSAPSIGSKKNPTSWLKSPEIIGTIKGEPGWKPMSTSVPILTAFIALSLLLAVGIETLAQRSLAQGALALSPSEDKIPGYARFLALYLPNIIAVLYSFCWTWIGFDVARMQPWYALSKPGGAPAAESIFLEYQNEFVATIPFTSAKKKHWSVFLSGTAMVLIFWCLTPIQSALLATDTITKSELATIAKRSHLYPVKQQGNRLDLSFYNDAYAISWLHQRYPPFTTSTYAVMPFYLDEEQRSSAARTDGNITALTKKLWMDIKCSQATAKPFTVFDEAHQEYRIFNENRQVGEVELRLDEDIQIHVDQPALGSLTSSTSYTWTATSAKRLHHDSRNQNFSITAIACEDKYYWQDVLATVSSKTLAPVDNLIRPVSEPKALPSTALDLVKFSYYSKDLPEVDIATRDQYEDYPNTLMLDQEAKFEKFHLSDDTDQIVGFTLPDAEEDLKEYFDPVKLEEKMRKVSQMLFAAGISKFFQNGTDFGNTTSTVTTVQSGIVVSRVFTALAEGLLILIAMITGGVLYLCWSSPSNLCANPSSVGRLLDIVRNSPGVRKEFHSFDDCDEKTLAIAFKDVRFYLRYDEQQRTNEILIQRAGDVPAIESISVKQRGFYDPIKPLVFRRATGFGFSGMLVAGIVILAYFKYQEKKLNGLPRPSKNHEVLQILENYIPTIFSTLVEPFWVLLTRTLCIFQPFRDLWTGRSQAVGSMDATYTAVPPQMVVLRAFKSSHFTLALLCMVALLANILSVGLSALFNEGPMVASYPQTFRPQVMPRFNHTRTLSFAPLTSNEHAGQGYDDVGYVVMANLTSGTPLPPWLTPEFFFQPHDIVGKDGFAANEAYMLQARGFGVDANCTAIATSHLPKIPSLTENMPQCLSEHELLRNAESQVYYQFWQSNLVPAGEGDTSGDGSTFESQYPGSDQSNRTSGSDNGDNVGIVDPPVLGRLAGEYCGAWGTWNQTHVRSPCNVPFTVGWFRAPSHEAKPETQSASFVICRPALKTAMFDVTVDRDGHVLSYDRKSPFETSLSYEHSKNDSASLFSFLNVGLDYKNEWTNTSIAKSWISYFMVTELGSRDFLDPNRPPPDTKPLVPAVESAYGRLFTAFLSLNTGFFDEPEQTDEEHVVGKRLVQETRIFMDLPSFIMATTILAIDILVALFFYARGVEFVLPRMPTSIGSIVAYLAPSRAANDAIPGSTPGRQSYGFGRYVGGDGKARMGIELAPHVVPINASLLGGANTNKPPRRILTRTSGDQPTGINESWV